MTDKQKKLWLVGQALQYMADTDKSTPDKEVLEYLWGTFVPEDRVENELIPARVSELSNDIKEFGYL
jgi:hypothetical protein